MVDLLVLFCFLLYIFFFSFLFSCSAWIIVSFVRILSLKAEFCNISSVFFGDLSNLMVFLKQLFLHFICNSYKDNYNLLLSGNLQEIFRDPRPFAVHSPYSIMHSSCTLFNHTSLGEKLTKSTLLTQKYKDSSKKGNKIPANSTPEKKKKKHSKLRFGKTVNLEPSNPYKNLT